LREIAARRTLLGNHWQTVLAVRDPLQVQEALTQAKVPRLSVRAQADPPRPDGTWLLKPVHGAGGRGIAVWDKDAAGSPTLQEPHYFQRRSHGEPISAVFIAHQNPFSIRYVGLTRQLIGMSELNAPPFAWCGTIGPIAIDVGGEILVRRTGSVIAHRFGLRGLFGCDFMLEAPDRPLLTEVNPRYTASVEVLEILCGLNLMQDHCRATGMDLPEIMPQSVLTAPFGATVGKVVLYAGQDSVAPDTSSWVRMTPVGPLPALADVPEQGTPLPRGRPVCTLLAAAASEGECLRYLLRRAADVARWL
ncbi:MAG: ATP-grasp domain-containing protein, partial [Planctomycetaceae bacterium]